MVEIGKMNDEKMCVSRHLGELLPCIVNYMNVRIFVLFFFFQIKNQPLIIKVRTEDS